MNIFKYISKTILGQNEESDNQILAESSKIQANDDLFQQIPKTIQQEVNDESVIEREIIQCQRLHGRLLGSTSKKLRKRFGKLGYNGNYYCSTVDRVINRFAKQRQRKNCPVKAQIKEEEKFPKSIIDHYFKEKYKAEFSTL